MFGLFIMELLFLHLVVSFLAGLTDKQWSIIGILIQFAALYFFSHGVLYDVRKKDFIVPDVVERGGLNTASWKHMQKTRKYHLIGIVFILLGSACQIAGVFLSGRWG